MMAPIDTMKSEIVGIGVSVLDLIMVVDALPHEEEVVKAVDRFSGLGGGVSVAMATATAMGIRTALLDCLGTDSVSESIVGMLNKAGVDVQFIHRDQAVSPSLASIWVRRATGSRTIVFSPGECIDAIWTEPFAQKVASAKFLHLNGRHLAASTKAVEIAKRSSTKVSYDGGAHRYRQEVLPLVEHADVLVVSEHFAATHCGIETDLNHPARHPEMLCQTLLHDFNAEIVGVTCGDRGSWFASVDGTAFHQPAHPVDRIVDTTGCGDTFHGAMLAAMVRDLPLAKCAEIAAKVASHQAEHLGAFSPTIVGLIDFW
jgi:sugar/nucleoside kinase (ribokinase family)